MNQFSFWSSTLAMLLIASSIHAAPTPAEKELAIKLYQQAVADMERKAYDRACPQFEAALKLDPKHVRTAISLATCEEQSGKLARALARFEFARKLAVEQSADEKIAEIDQALANLTPRVPRLRLVVNQRFLDSSGLTVVRNGIEVPASDFDKTLAVDPGTYEIKASSTETGEWKRTLTIQPGQSLEITIGDDAGPRRIERSEISTPPQGSTTARTVGFAGIGIGAATLVAGSVLGGLAISKNSDSDDGHCDAENRCDAIGTSLRLKAQDYGNASTALFAVGGAVMIGSIVLVAKSPAKNEAKTALTARLHVGPTGVAVRGSW